MALARLARPQSFSCFCIGLCNTKTGYSIFYPNELQSHQSLLSEVARKFDGNLVLNVACTLGAAKVQIYIWLCCEKRSLIKKTKKTKKTYLVNFSTRMWRRTKWCHALSSRKHYYCHRVFTQESQLTETLLYKRSHLSQLTDTDGNANNMETTHHLLFFPPHTTRCTAGVFSSCWTLIRGLGRRHAMTVVVKFWMFWPRKTKSIARNVRLMFAKGTTHSVARPPH